MKKNNCVVLGGTSNQVFAVACVLMDLKKFCSNWLEEVVYFHDGLLQKEQELLLNEIFPCRCLEYEIPVNTDCFHGNRSIIYFSKMVFCKFETLKLLSEYKTVIWLDYDIVILKNLKELNDFCESGIKFLNGGRPVRYQLREEVNEYKMNVPCIASGTFVFQDHIGDFLSMHIFCYENLFKYAPKLSLPEQAIFDFMIQYFNLETEWLDSNIYAPHPRNASNLSNVKILHAYGQPKFWDGIYNEQWNKNYKEWVKMGGLKKPFALKKLLKNFIKELIRKSRAVYYSRCSNVGK